MARRRSPFITVLAPVLFLGAVGCKNNNKRDDTDTGGTDTDTDSSASAAPAIPPPALDERKA
jgi:hypothetical protein